MYEVLGFIHIRPPVLSHRHSLQTLGVKALKEDDSHSYGVQVASLTACSLLYSSTRHTEKAIAKSRLSVTDTAVHRAYWYLPLD